MDNRSDRSALQRWIIVALLALVFVAQLFSILYSYQQDQLQRERAATYEQRVEEAQQVLERQRDVISDLVSDYESAAYGNPYVEQQLLAAEFQLTALQAIAIQNTQIIESSNCTVRAAVWSPTILKIL